MGKGDRSWEAPRRDPEVNQATAYGTIFAFVIAILVCIGILGANALGAITGTIAGIVIAIGISRLSVRSARGRDDGPPPPLL